MATKKPKQQKKQKPTGARGGSPRPPVTGRSASLTALEARFAQEYQRDMNGTQAYQRCKPDAKATSARVAATRLLAKTNVQDEIARLRVAAANAAGIDARTVVETAWAMMTADPRELVEHVVGCCRHCWGTAHRFQRTDGELADERARHKMAVATAGTAAQRKKLGDFDVAGGGGYDVRREANPQCPSCGGAGIGRTVVKDTRKLSPAAVQLLAGIKEGKEGIEVKMHSKDAALDKMFRHFGLYKDKIELTMPTAIVKDLTGRKDAQA